MSSPHLKPPCRAPRNLRPLSDEALELIARRFAILSEPMRLRLLHSLFNAEKSVGALVGETRGTQANVSRHLQSLAGAGILARRKDGLQVFYSIADPSIYKLCDLTCGSIERQLARQAGAFGDGAA
jgi:ArsR family transcriptional regulator